MPFSNFRLVFSTVPHFLIDILSSFLQISQFFFKGLLKSLHKVIIKICPKFYSSLLKNFHANSKVFLNIFVTLKLFFSKN